MDHHKLLAGSSEMGARTLAFDWASTPLGPVEGWSSSLKAAVGTVLNCQLPMYLAWGPEHTQLYNDAYLPILGPRHPAALGRTAPETWPEIWPTIGPMWADALGGKPVGFDDFKLTIERFGYPEERFFHFSYSPVPDDDGRPAGVLVTFVDTTDRVLAERRALFQLELADGLRGLSTPDDITRWTCTVLGKHLGARRVGYALVREGRIDVQLQGWHDGTVETLVGQSLPLQALGPGVEAALLRGETVRLDDVAGDPRTRAHPEAFERLRAPAMLLVPVVREGRLIALVAVGSREVRRWTDHEVALVEDAAERTRSAVERAIAEQAQARADAYYRFVLDRTVAAVVVHDASGAIVFANPVASTFLGLSVDTMQGRLLTDPSWRFVREDGSPMPLEEFPVSIVARTRKPLHNYVFGILPRPDVGPTWVLVNAFPQLDERGGLERTVVSFIDISPRKEAEQRLLEADRRKDEFLAMLAHELRNPLAPISTAAHLLQVAAGDAERVRGISELVARQAGHMTKLVDDLLDVSRVTRGLVQLQRERLELPAVVAAAVEQVRPLLEQRGQVLTTTVTPGPSWVSGDRVRLTQVVANLLGNAAKYTPQGGAVDVRLQAEGGVARIVVSDNGVGIEPALLPRIFELFTQGERTPDRHQGGLGVGLALVKTLVGMHGGRVQAESAGPGRGSRFEVALPTLPPEPAASRPPAPAPRGPARALALMLVDDNVDAAETLAELLGAHGHRVAVAHTGREALALAEGGGPFDALVLDIGLPDMTGHALAEALRERLARAAGGPPVLIALTGYGQESDRAASRAAGFHHHLIKPVDVGRLLGILERLPGGRPGAALDEG
jgi:PAS domain S-box-containing protein